MLRPMPRAIGHWAAPLPSSYGLHLVWVHEKEPERAMELEAVRSQVREALLAERGDAALEAELERLRYFDLARSK